jgi:ADP-heptose:LPS heptosyltransferase
MKKYTFKEANLHYRSGNFIESYLMYKILSHKNSGFRYYKDNCNTCISKIYSICNERNSFVKNTYQTEFYNNYIDIEKESDIDYTINTNIKKNSKILIAKPSGIGNMILFLPALKCLIDAMPDAEITVLCYKSDGLVLSDYRVKIDNFPVIEDINSRQICFGEYLKKNNYDLILYPPFTALKPPNEIESFTGIHVVHPRVDFESRHEAVHNFEMLKLIGIKAPLKNFIKPEALLRRQFIENKIHYFVIHAGSSSSFHMRKKRWPLPYWADVTEELSKIAPVCFIGGHDDVKDADEIFQHLKVRDITAYNMVCIFDWSELKDFIGNSTVFISNDSGLMHLAATTEVPIVSIFGPTNPIKNSPFRYNDVKIYVASNVKCAPCYKGKSKKLWNCERQVCLESIEPMNVYDSVKKFLSVYNGDAI